MLTSTTGWGRAGERMLRTTDGGTHWQDVTPPCLPNGEAYVVGDTLIDLAAWVWASQDETTRLFTTTDGGRTWQQRAALHHTNVIAMSFLPPKADLALQDGWALVNRSGTHDGADVELVRTRDGGTTWTSVSSTGTPTHPGSIPSPGKKEGVCFLNPTTGWLGGIGFPEARLEVTHDGGRTWQQQALPFQADATQHQFDIGLPVFYNDQGGLLSVTVLTQTREVVDQRLYLTQDGGSTWQQSATLPVDALYSFSDSQHGWMVNSAWVNGTTLETTLSVTSDSGQHWSTLPGGAAFQEVTLLDFLSTSLGWAISQSGTGGSVLLRTGDGGQTWTSVTPLLLP
jgi:photosystem II stability/assembly factor-like uncharacterized protein